MAYRIFFIVRSVRLVCSVRFVRWHPNQMLQIIQNVRHFGVFSVRTRADINVQSRKEKETTVPECFADNSLKPIAVMGLSITPGYGNA